MKKMVAWKSWDINIPRGEKFALQAEEHVGDKQTKAIHVCASSCPKLQFTLLWTKSQFTTWDTISYNHKKKKEEKSFAET